MWQRASVQFVAVCVRVHPYQPHGLPEYHAGAVMFSRLQTLKKREAGGGAVGGKVLVWLRFLHHPRSQVDAHTRFLPSGISGGERAMFPSRAIR